MEAQIGGRSASVRWTNHLSASAPVLLPTTWPGGECPCPDCLQEQTDAWRSEQLLKVPKPVCGFFMKSNSRYLNPGQSDPKPSS